MNVHKTLDELVEFVDEDLQQVNTLIVERMQSSVPLIPQLASYIINAGGKRLRPLLTLLTARLFQYQGHHHIKLATAVECIHTATLLHDDVVDESILRRGQDSANTLFGNKASVLVGDFLFSCAFLLMVETRSLDVLRILSKASAIIAEGEVLQLQHLHNIHCTQEQYLQVIRSKTAVLFGAACRIGGTIAQCPQEHEYSLQEYGIAVGMAFQLIDDVLDYTALESRLGKRLGDDFRDQKITLPVILEMQRCDAEDKNFWSRVFEQGEQRPEDLEYAIARLEKNGTLKETINYAKHYAHIATNALHGFPESVEKNLLLSVVHFTVERHF